MATTWEFHVGPRVQLELPGPGHLWPELAVELLGRVAVSAKARAWHVAASLLGEGLLVFGLSPDQLRTGLAGERAVWKKAADDALALFDCEGTGRANDAAVEAYSAAELRVEQATLLLTAVQASARVDRRDETRPVAPGHGLPPDMPRMSYGSGASRHGCEQTRSADRLDANGVDVDATYERQVQRMHDHRYGDGPVDW